MTETEREAKELLEECIKQFKSNLTVEEEEKIVDKMSKIPLEYLTGIKLHWYQRLYLKMIL